MRHWGDVISATLPTFQVLRAKYPMSPTIDTSMNAKSWLLLLILSLLWGGSFFLIELALQALPPLTIVSARVACAALALWVFVAVAGLPVPKTAQLWRMFLLMGLLNNVLPFCLIVWGQTHITSGLASILNATTPLFTVIVAGWLLNDERLTIFKCWGVAVGFMGVVLMIGPPMLQGLGDDLLAQLAILAAALSYACAGVYGRRFKAMGIDPIVSATGQVTAAAIVIAPLALVYDRWYLLPWPSTQAITALLCLGFVSTAVAYTLYFRLLASSGATNLALVTFLVPVFAIGFGTLLLGEPLLASHLWGMGLIALGMSVIDGRLWRYLLAKNRRTARGAQ